MNSPIAISDIIGDNRSLSMLNRKAAILTRCVHCGDVFSIETAIDGDGHPRPVDDMATCTHCGGVVAMMPLDDTPSSRNMRPQSTKPVFPTVRKVIRQILRGAKALRANAQAIRKRIAVQLACCMIAQALSISYLLCCDNMSSFLQRMETQSSKAASCENMSVTQYLIILKGNLQRRGK